MSKLGAVSATAGVGGTGAVGVGGAYLAGAFGGSGEYGGRYISPTIDGLEKSSGGCIDHTFPYWYIPKTTLSSMSSDVIFDDTSGETGGCLVFNWEKKNKNNK